MVLSTSANIYSEVRISSEMVPWKRAFLFRSRLLPSDENRNLFTRLSRNNFGRNTHFRVHNFNWNLMSAQSLPRHAAANLPRPSRNSLLGQHSLWSLISYKFHKVIYNLYTQLCKFISNKFPFGFLQNVPISPPSVYAVPDRHGDAETELFHTLSRN